MANCVQCGRALPGFGFGKRLCKWCVQHQAAQRGEVPDDAVQPVMETPWVQRERAGPLVTHAIFGINVAVFMGMVLAGVSITSPDQQQLIHWGANAGPYTLSGQWWRLLTCVFVHAGIIHIGVNMWCLWNLGELAEGLYGHVTFALVYLVAGVGASVTSLAWHQDVPSVGASGAIFGIAGALIASLKLGAFSLPSAHVKAMLSSVVTFAVYNIAFGAVIPFVDNAAHIGGLVTGLLLGALIAVVAPAPFHYFRRFFILALVLALVAGGAAWTQRSRGYVVHLQRAQELLRDNKTDEAISELRTAIRQRPDFLPASRALAALYTEQSKFSDAAAVLKPVVERDPKNEQARLRLGDLYARAKQPQLAESIFRQVVTQNPKNAAAHFGLGYALSSEGKPEQAIEEYKAATKIAPRIEDANYNIGLCYARLKQYDEAISAFQREIVVSGDNADIEDALADAYSAKGMAKQADEAKAKAAQLKNAPAESKDDSER
jgi:rhomboid protease GluP